MRASLGGIHGMLVLVKHEFRMVVFEELDGAALVLKEAVHPPDVPLLNSSALAGG